MVKYERGIHLEMVADVITTFTEDFMREQP